MGHRCQRARDNGRAADGERLKRVWRSAPRGGAGAGAEAGRGRSGGGEGEREGLGSGTAAPACQRGQEEQVSRFGRYYKEQHDNKAHPASLSYK